MNKAYKYRIYPNTDSAIAAEQGKQLVLTDKWFPSSKMCRFCNNENKKLTLADRTWNCSYCGAEIDRDINAAINIKNEGCRLLGIA